MSKKQRRERLGRSGYVTSTIGPIQRIFVTAASRCSSCLSGGSARRGSDPFESVRDTGMSGSRHVFIWWHRTDDRGESLRKRPLRVRAFRYIDRRSKTGTDQCSILIYRRPRSISIYIDLHRSILNKKMSTKI